jgi:hypothetical protein
MPKFLNKIFKNFIYLEIDTFFFLCFNEPKILIRGTLKLYFYSEHPANRVVVDALISL